MPRGPSFKKLFVLIICMLVVYYYYYNYQAISPSNGYGYTGTSGDGYKSKSKPRTFIFNVDSRPILSVTTDTDTDSVPNVSPKNYWSFAAISNYLYSLHHGYKYYYLYANISCHGFICDSYYDNFTVHPAWIKIKGILWMLNHMNDNDIAVYMDSDVMINKKYFNLSLIDFYINSNHSFIFTKDFQSKFDWNNTYKCEKNSILLLIDDKTAWFRMIRDSNYTYSSALNTGIIILRKCDIVEHLINVWWQSVNISTPLQQYLHWDMSSHWPFEQERLNYIVNTKLYQHHTVFQLWSLKIAKEHLFIHYTGNQQIKETLQNDALQIINSHNDYNYNATASLKFIVSF